MFCGECCQLHPLAVDQLVRAVSRWATTASPRCRGASAHLCGFAISICVQICFPISQPLCVHARQESGFRRGLTLRAFQLTTMPSLEVLDISRNRIKRLPPDPGALRNLRVCFESCCSTLVESHANARIQVFSISRNRFTKLPHYLANFQNLTVFKVSHNPIMWPDGMKEEPDDVDDSDAMKHWIAALKRWLEESARLAEAQEENGDVSSFSVVKESTDPAPSDVDPVRCEACRAVHTVDPISDDPAVVMRTCHICPTGTTFC